MNRRTLLAAAGGAAAGLLAPGTGRAAPTPFAQPKLPYAEDALAPVISPRTVALHYGKHHKAYFDKLNQLAAETPYAGLPLEEVVTRSHAAGDQAIFNQAGQAWNHVLYWNQFEGGPAAPEGRFLDLAQSTFGGVDGLKQAMTESADKVFGTGWVWLASDGRALRVLSMQDAGNPLTEGLTPLCGIDVWEHAYYLDYENRKAEHVKAVLDRLVNWRFVGARLPA
ncbi:superoxide dismutase [Aureimonas endophytica]